MIDLTVDASKLDVVAAHCRARGIRLPTFEEMRHPGRIAPEVVAGLKDIGLWDLHPLNLFRINWHNEPTEKGGAFGGVNYVVWPSAITGVEARIIQLIGKWFPTGAHKVGAAYGCLVPQLATGQFDPSVQKAVWPSTGNYCRGGAYDSNLLGCESVAILPEGMSRERFEWLETVAGSVIKTPGTESNVKEIFDKCNELAASGEDLVIFNQFAEFGNYLWHYSVTGPAMEEAINEVGGTFQGLVVTTGSAGTIAAGDYLKQRFPHSKIGAGEAIQCPTMLYNGFGEHRIEGIGDKHIPWVHNVRNTDFAIGIDDEASVSLSRLFNEPAGIDYLRSQGVSDEAIADLPLLGFSGAANLVGAAKFAKYNELTAADTVVTVGTDSMDLYQSRLREMHEDRGDLTTIDAAAAHHRYMLGAGIDHVHELTYYDRKRVHNLKYFTWVEQQGMDTDELRAQWHDPDYWSAIQRQGTEIDALISDFNERVWS